MDTATRYNPNRMKLFLISAILISIGTLAALFIGNRNAPVDTENSVTPLTEGASLTLSNLRHTATREGRIEWRLEAERARLINSKKEAALEDLGVTFFLRDGDQITLSAKRGLLKTDTNDITVEGDVLATGKGFQMKTERLQYEHGGRRLFSRVPVEISGTSLRLSSGTMSMDLNTNQILFSGNVNGTFDKDLLQ